MSGSSELRGHQSDTACERVHARTNLAYVAYLPNPRISDATRCVGDSPRHCLMFVGFRTAAARTLPNVWLWGSEIELRVD